MAEKRSWQALAAERGPAGAAGALSLQSYTVATSPESRRATCSLRRDTSPVVVVYS